MASLDRVPPLFLLPLQAQYYSAPHSQFRFFQRLAQAFVRVGLIDDGRAQGQMGSYMPGATLSVKEAVSAGYLAVLVLRTVNMKCHWCHV